MEEDEIKLKKERKVFESKVNEFADKWKNRTDYLESPEILIEAIKEYESLESGLSAGEDGASTKEAFYYWLKFQKNQEDKEVKAKLNNAEEFITKIENQLSFFFLNIGKIGKEKQPLFLNSEKLKDYKHFLERTFEIAKHNLSEKEEKILNLLNKNAYSNWTRMTSQFLSAEQREVVLENGEVKVKNFSEIQSLMNSTVKKTRDSASNAFNEILEKWKGVAEFEINSVLGYKKIEDELREFERPDSSRHLSDDIDSDIVYSLIESVSERFDISRRFYELKSKIFNVGKLKYHERNVPVGNIDIKYGFDKAVELVNKVFSDLDNEFSEIFIDFIKNGKIDVFPKKGKRGGAFCTDNNVNQPTFVLLNHTNELADVLTIAHEMGHAINSELKKRKESYLNFGTPLSTAEVASTYMEDFVIKKLIEDADEESRFSLIMSKLNGDISTIIRQVACYKFELELHSKYREKGYLSFEEIGEIFERNMADYMGDYVEQSTGSENWWIHWRHIRNYFYVYSYASGLLISKAMQRKTRENKDFVLNVKQFLSTGTSKSPREIFLNLGVDITEKDFWQSGLKEIDELLKEAEHLAKKLGKIKR